MSYTSKDWTERIRNRSDMSGYLYHLTRETDDLSATENLIKILNERKINGSTTKSGFIIGPNKAVCFQDTTLYGVSQNTFHEQKLRDSKKTNKIRYRPIGLAFGKRYIFNKGGRPVIYEKSDFAKTILPQDEWWRIVDYDLSDENNIVDWTHEREWRLKGDLMFDLNNVHVVLTHEGSYNKFISKADEKILKGIKGIIILDPVIT